MAGLLRERRSGVTAAKSIDLVKRAQRSCGSPAGQERPYIGVVPTKAAISALTRVFDAPWWPQRCRAQSLYCAARRCYEFRVLGGADGAIKRLRPTRGTGSGRLLAAWCWIYAHRFAFAADIRLRGHRIRERMPD